MLPALGVALVKPCVVGTTARASKENVRSIGYSIYYTLVNIGGAAGPYVASWVHQHMRVENVFRVAALSVFAMFFAVLLLFKEPRRSGEMQTVSLSQSAKNFWTVLSNPRFMVFLLIFSGYWVVYWQEFIILPLYIHDYIDPKANTELLLVAGPAHGHCAATAGQFSHAAHSRIPRHHAGNTDLRRWPALILIAHPTVPMAVLTLITISLGEIILSPRYYEYISRLAPPGQQGTYMGFAFLPIGIGSIIGGWFGGQLIHHFGEVTHQPGLIWWPVVAVGVATAGLLWIYDKTLKPALRRSKPNS